MKEGKVLRVFKVPGTESLQNKLCPTQSLYLLTTGTRLYSNNYKSFPFLGDLYTLSVGCSELEHKPTLR
jgi:hypothetical protein